MARVSTCRQVATADLQLANAEAYRVARLNIHAIRRTIMTTPIASDYRLPFTSSEKAYKPTVGSDGVFVPTTYTKTRITAFVLVIPT